MNAEVKFQFFDNNTDYLTLLVVPIIVGLALAVVLPWINLLGMTLASLPDRKQKELRNNSAHQDSLNKFEYETKMEEFKARKQKAIVDSAKADEEAMQISDPDLRKKVQDNLEVVAQHVGFGETDANSITFSHDEEISLENVSEQISSLEVMIDDTAERLSQLVAEADELDRLDRVNEDAYRQAIKDASGKDEVSIKLARAKSVKEYRTNKDSVNRDMQELIGRTEALKRRREYLLTQITNSYGL